MLDSGDSLTMNEYVESVVQGYSYANSLTVDSISNAIPVVDAETLEEDHYVFFTFDENVVKGFINVYGEESFTSNFIKTDVGIVEGDKINIFCKDNEVFFVKNEEIYHLGGEYNDFTGYLYPECDKIEVACYEVESSIFNLTRANPIYYYLQVPFVANDSVDDIGICWAACIASRVNYHNGTSYTAMQIYDACNNSEDSNRPTGTPEGSNNWILFGYSLYGINATSVSGGKNLGQIESLLANDKPIMCFISRVVVDANGEEKAYGHGVLLIGVYIYGSSNIYMFRDPNEPNGIVSINVSEEALTDATKVTYSNSYHTYPNWFRSVY